MMGSLQSSEFRKILCAKREEMLRHSRKELTASLSGEIARSFKAGLDEGDSASFNQYESMRCSRLDSRWAGIRQIDAALKRMEEGTYGVCEECGGEIGEDRLRIIPAALYCRECQETREMQGRKRN